MCEAYESIALNLSTVKESSVSKKEFPVYLIFTPENTKSLGGIVIIIDYKKSTYEGQQQSLKSILQEGDKLKIRSQTDLPNSMSAYGFEIFGT